MTRRFLVRNSALALFGVGSAPAWLARAAGGPGGARNKVLVAVFQRGAADGLNMVVPFAEKNYYELRPAIAVPEPGKQRGAIDLDGRFGLHPQMEPFAKLYKAGHLAIVHAAGSPDPTRSHFDAQDYMESGTPGRKSTRDGWMNRALEAGDHFSPLRAVALGTRLPRAMRGANGAVALPAVREFEVRERRTAMAAESMYTKAGDADLAAPGRDTFEAIRLLDSIRSSRYTPANGADYPNGRFGTAMQEIARVIKAGVGLEVAFADMGGWDHHANENQALPGMLAEFSGTLAAFHADLGERMADVTVVTMSEFGRTVRENGSAGTDHGHANVMFAMGGAVRGGRLLGQWPGLEVEQLYERRDLAVTTDFRDVLTEAATAQLGKVDLSRMFPGHSPSKVGLTA